MICLMKREICDARFPFLCRIFASGGARCSGIARLNGADWRWPRKKIALANIALDLIGQVKLAGYAGEEEGAGRTANDLAFLRDAYDFRNLLMLELPNEDFGRTIMRHFFYDAFQVPWLEALSASSDERVSHIAQKAAKEAIYHLERSEDAVIALGDGTEESNQRMQKALNDLWPFAGEVFRDDDIDRAMHDGAIAPLPSSSIRLENAGAKRVAAGLFDPPDSEFAHSGDVFDFTQNIRPYVGTMQFLQCLSGSHVVMQSPVTKDQIWDWLMPFPIPKSL